MASCIRFAEHRDLSALEQIENDADRLLVERFQAKAWSAAPSGDSRLSKSGFLLVIELDGGGVPGFVHVLEVQGLCHLEQVSVTSEHSRQGWGRMLVEAAKQEARQRGYDSISLRTYADVPWNAPFYETAGFVEEQPATRFHRSLVGIEAELGLDQYGRRIQMAASLTGSRP